MQSFEYHCPTEIVFGREAETKTAAKISKYGGHRVLVVYGGGSVVKSGLLARLESQFTEAGLVFKSLGGVQPNPRLSLARQGVKEAIAFGADFILGVGGGSVIDTAKAVAHGTANPDIDIWEFWSGRQLLEKSLPVGVVLTIAAAGSETSNSAVLTNAETGRKSGLHTDLNRPAFAIMNPELTYTLPQYQIACGIADILMHTLERYFTKVEGNDFTDRVAEALLKDVIFYGPRALANHKDYEAMSELMWCGSVSHNGFTGLGRAQDFAAHKLGHELSARFDVAHGASLTTMWGAWARTVYMDQPERFAKFAAQVWDVQVGTQEEKARAGIRCMEEFFHSIGMPVCFTELGIGVQPSATLEYLADMCTDYGKKTVAVFHPIDRSMALQLYTMANH
mgnify:FL=1